MKSLIRFTALSIVGLISYANAELIEVCGDVSGTWSADTIIAIGDLRIPPGDSLTIEPGVLILFHQYYQFIVDEEAILYAVGTEDNEITFDERFPGNGWHGIRFISASDSSRLEFCNIKNGLAIGEDDEGRGGGIFMWSSNPTIIHCNIENCKAELQGAGICCRQNSNPQILNSIIRWDTVTAQYGEGGGIYCSDNSNPVIEQCSIYGNSAYFGGGVYCTYSGSNTMITNNVISENDRYGIYLYASNPIIENNEILSNEEDGLHCRNISNPTVRNNHFDGNEIYAIRLEQSHPVIIGCRIENSRVGIYGRKSNAEITLDTIFNNSSTSSPSGGIYFYDSSPTISYCVIYSNSSDDGGGIGFFDVTNGKILHNLVYNNISYESGGGLLLWESSAEVINNTICSNMATICGGGIYCYSSSPVIRNSILYFNEAPESPQLCLEYGSAPDITYSDLQVDWPGDGNINADPLFRDRFNGDLHLMEIDSCGYQYNSPCIDAGDPLFHDSVLSCELGLGTNRSDMGAYGGNKLAVDVDNDTANILPGRNVLSQNYPNPFNPATTIHFALPRASDVKLVIYNILGQRVITLVDEKLSPGEYDVVWNGNDGHGRAVSSGVYFYRIEAAEFVNSKKMLLLK